MAQAIAKRTMRMMITGGCKVGSSRSLFGISNSLSPTTNFSSSFLPAARHTTTNRFHPSFCIPATSRNFKLLPYLPSFQDQLPPNTKPLIPEKYQPWIVLPVAIVLAFCGVLQGLRVPFCMQTPVVDREDHVRYSFRLERAVRQEDVKFKIVDNSVLELSYMYRHFTDRRVVKKELPKGNYANAEVRGWLEKYNVFLVDITGFQREPAENLQLSGEGGRLSGDISVGDEKSPISLFSTIPVAGDRIPAPNG